MCAFRNYFKVYDKIIRTVRMIGQINNNKLLKGDKPASLNIKLYTPARGNILYYIHLILIHYNALYNWIQILYLQVYNNYSLVIN